MYIQCQLIHQVQGEQTNEKIIFATKGWKTLQKDYVSQDLHTMHLQKLHTYLQQDVSNYSFEEMIIHYGFINHAAMQASIANYMQTGTVENAECYFYLAARAKATSDSLWIANPHSQKQLPQGQEVPLDCIMAAVLSGYTSAAIDILEKTRIPSNERIPYVRGEALTQEIIDRLTGQILSGCVRSIQLDDETQENSLVANFRDGWSTVYIVKECENYYEFVNDQFSTCETQLNITGDGPTPQKHATEDMRLMSEIISYFAQTGEIYTACTWEHTIH